MYKIRLLVLYSIGTSNTQVLLQILQVDVPPYKNQAFCRKLNLLIYYHLITSCEQRLITKEHIAMHLN